MPTYAEETNFDHIRDYLALFDLNAEWLVDDLLECADNLEKINEEITETDKDINLVKSL